MQATLILFALGLLGAVVVIVSVLLRQSERAESRSKAGRRAALESSDAAAIRQPLEIAPEIGVGIIGVIGIGIVIWFIHSYAPGSGASTFPVASGIAAFIWRQIKRRRTLSAEQVREKDRRSPILFLRPFDEDRKAHQHATGWHPSLEEELASAFGCYGPFVALHDPRLRHPFSGAARLVAKESPWWIVVSEYLRECQFVVLLATAVTDSYRWEIEASIGAVDPERLVIVLPRRPKGTMDSKVYDEFRRGACHLFPRGVPYHPNEDAFLLVFEADWTPVCIVPKHSEYMQPLADCVQSYRSMRARGGVWHRLRTGAPAQPSLPPPPAPPPALFELATPIAPAAPATSAHGQSEPANVRFYWP